MTETIWQPDPSTVGQTNVARFMSRHGIDRFEDLLALR